MVQRYATTLALLDGLWNITLWALPSAMVEYHRHGQSSRSSSWSELTIFDGAAK